MSYFRIRSRTINNNTYYDNALTSFTNPPIHTGNLHVRGSETVGGNLTVGHDFRTENVYASGNYYLNNYVLIPAGTIVQSAAINAPNGWLTCDGASVLVSVYTALHDAIGYTYGGSGLSFSIPDMRGSVGVGVGGGYNLGTSGGEASHTLTVAEMPSHSHTLTRRANADTGTYDTGNGHQDESSAATTDRDDLGPFSTSAVGDGNAHNNMPPYVVIRYLIKY